MSQTPTAGVPCWIDMMSSDTAKSRAFYSGLFGWDAAEGSEEFGGYFMFMRGEMPVAGAMPQPPGVEAPDEWTIYLSSDNARKTIETAEAAGCEVLSPPMDVADLGTTAVLVDPAGNRVGVWQANTFPGIVVRGEAGAQAWFELHSRDYDNVVGFYREVFGWDAHTMSDTPEFRYTTLGQNEAAVAGIMDASALPADAQTGWKVYIQVEDTDASVKRAQSLGGSVVSDAQDSPYGRLAEVADTTGCQIKVMGPNA